MSTTLKPATVEVKKRGGYRRLLVVTALVIFGSLAVWMIWGAIRDWTDARALEAYFAELEQREPGWRDRVYGKELTAAQLDDHQRWSELEQALTTHCNKAAWSPYRQGLYQGMVQDAAQPAAEFPLEQQEYLKAAHQYWQPIIQMIIPMKKLPTRNRNINRADSYVVMRQQFFDLHSPSTMTNEVIELEAYYRIMMNEPENALRCLILCSPSPYYFNYSGPFLIERWLNLTQPQATSLLQLQRMLEQQSQEIERLGFSRFGSELRLTEKLIREIASNELTQAQLQSLQLYEMLFGRNPSWDKGWLKWARKYYLSLRIQNLFNRPNYLILRLHQMADRIEELSSIEPLKRWSTWKKFAQEHSILIDFQTTKKPLQLEQMVSDSGSCPNVVLLTS